MSNQTDFLSIMNGVRLSGGAHRKAGAEMCAMEMVAWLEGEPHSDKPICACPVIGRFVIGLNDRLRDGERDQLLPFLPRIVGTRATKAIERERGQYLAWKALTVFAPLALDASGRRESANALRAIAMPADQAEWAAARQIARAAAASAYAASAYAAAAAAARQSVIKAWLAVLDGVLSIGPSGAGFTRPLPAPGEAARKLGMVTA